MRIVRVRSVSTNRGSFVVPECYSQSDRLVQPRMQLARMSEASEESRSVKALINKLGFEGF